MGTTLATKSDLENLRMATKQDLQSLKDVIDVRFTLVDQRFESLRNDLARDLVTMRQSIIIQLGSMMVICFSLALGIVRLWIQASA